MLEIAREFLKLGATAYGGPAIMGIMQAELQGRRQWVSRARFLEGLSIANLLPGATATQLAIFLGHARGGFLGGLVAGLAFMLPGFAIILALTVGYAALGMTPVLRHALYGLGPVVIAIYAVAVYRLGASAVRSVPQVLIGIAAAAVTFSGAAGVTATLLLAGAVGILLFHSRRFGALVLALLVVGLLTVRRFATAVPVVDGAPHPPTLGGLTLFLLEVGALTFGGGLSMIAFIQEQLVRQWQWLTPQEFIDGLALGQLTPGPVLTVAAYVGFKTFGMTGAVVGTAAAFLPSFVLMLAILPALERVRQLTWAKAAMNGIGPAVIGALAVSLARLVPHAVPDAFAAVVLIASLVVLTVRRVGIFTMLFAGGALGVLRKAYAWR